MLKQVARTLPRKNNACTGCLHPAINYEFISCQTTSCWLKPQLNLFADQRNSINFGTRQFSLSHLSSWLGQEPDVPEYSKLVFLGHC